MQRIYDLCILFSKFWYVLPAFTCTSAIGILRSICLEINILIHLSSNTLRSQTIATLAALATPANSEGCENNTRGSPLLFCC